MAELRRWVAVVLTLVIAVGCTTVNQVDDATDNETNASEAVTTVPTKGSATPPVTSTVDPSVATATPESSPTESLPFAVLATDGRRVNRINPDGSVDELHRMAEDESSTLYNVRSDGNGGILFQTRGASNERDAITWLAAGASTAVDVVVAEPRIQLRLEAVHVLDTQQAEFDTRILYQRIDSTGGAPRSLGTLRALQLGSRLDTGLDFTGAWESGTTFSAGPGAELAAVYAGHESASLYLVDSTDGTRRDVPGDIADRTVAVATPDGVVTVHIERGDAHDVLHVQMINAETGSTETLASIVDTTKQSLIENLFIRDGIAVISRSLRDGPEPIRPLVVDLANGTSFELDDEAWLSPADPAELVVDEPGPHPVDALTFDEVMFDGIEPLPGNAYASYDAMVAALGEPISVEEFEWHGGIGYRPVYENFRAEIHYDVNGMATTAEGVCTVAGLCIGDSFTRLEQVYGLMSGHQAVLPTSSGTWVRTERYTRPLVDNNGEPLGNCAVAFWFTTSEDPSAERTLREISRLCAPD